MLKQKLHKSKSSPKLAKTKKIKSKKVKNVEKAKKHKPKKIVSDSELAKKEDNLSEDGNISEDSEKDLDPEEHKKALEKLKHTDPDFYHFLQKNDKNLLDFNLDDSDGDDRVSDLDEDENIHKPSSIEGDSEESDFEPEDGSVPQNGNKITLKMISEWQTELQSEKKIKLMTLNNVVKAFNAAMLRVASENTSKEKPFYKVEGSSIFNAVVQMCVLYLPPAIKRYLNFEQSGKDPQKCKHFVKIKPLLIAYFTDLLKLLASVTSTNILTVLLKHLHHMSVYVISFLRISKQLLKRLIILWSTSEETVRVLAFLCILRITRNQQALLLESVLKIMYMTYVKNCKFVSPTTWPGIHFMRRSLVEMFSLDLNVSYQHVFLYIRQLAIHLRNAIVVQKTETRLAVYNWHFVNSINLWAELLGATCNKPQLQPLIYPLVMVITNTIKLVPTAHYYPLRFHLVDILIKLSKDSDTYIPILPFILEVLSYDFNKRHKKVSMKPLDFSCILRVSKSQLAENGFKDTTIDRVYGLLLEYMANMSNSIAFPDLSVLCLMQLNKFVKTCRVSNYTKRIRQLTEKIEENSKYIALERKKISFTLSDTKLINAWETTIRNKGTPLLTFYESWFKINKLQKKKKFTKNEELADDLPVIKKIKRPETEVLKSDGPVELFPSDSEGEDIGFPGNCDDEADSNDSSE